jgi:flavin-dependent dehydrogenase
MTETDSVDVLIIGGGPAGAAAGAWLAQRGKRTMILEKEAFPRFSVGESLLPHGNDILKEIGVWEKLEEAGFLRKYGAEFCTGDSQRMLRFWFGRNLGKTHEYSFQVERSKFDAILLDHARASGCEVLEQTRATRVEQGAGSMRVTFTHRGEERQIGARWLLDASGRSAFAGNRLGIKRKTTQKTRRIAIYGHFQQVFRNAGKAEGHITIVRGKEGWFWLIPLAGGITSVGLVLPLSKGGTPTKMDTDNVFFSAVESSQEVRERMLHAKAVCDLRTTGDYSWRHESFACDRILLLGDAAGFVDPIFSSGVMLALKSAVHASQLVLRADEKKRGLSYWEQISYTRDVSGWMKQYSRIIGAFYDRAGFEVFMNPTGLFQIPASIGRLVGGFARPTLWDRFRLRTFYLICALQRSFTIAPPIRWLREATDGS